MSITSSKIEWKILIKGFLSNTNVPAYFFGSTTGHFMELKQPIPFQKIIAESNSGFDGSTGTMTTKKHGLYFITVTVMKKASSTTRIFLMHNDQKIGQALSNTPNYDMITLSATLRLNVNDKIWVQLGEGKIYGDDQNYGVFTGVKISDV